MTDGNRSGFSGLSLLAPCALGFLLCCDAIAADCNQSAEARPILKSYCGSAMPDGIAFYLVATLIVDREDEHSERLDKVDNITSIADIDAATAASLIEAITPSARALLIESDTEVRKSVCLPELTSWDSKKASSVLNQLEDLHEAIYTRHTIGAMIALAAEEQEHFRELLDDMKSASSYVRTDYTKAYRDNPEGAQASLRSFCNL